MGVSGAVVDRKLGLSRAALTHEQRIRGADRGMDSAISEHRSRPWRLNHHVIETVPARHWARTVLTFTVRGQLILRQNCQKVA
jgi:hypothetical protein